MTRQLSVKVGKLTVVTDKRALVFTVGSISASATGESVTLRTQARTAVRVTVGSIVTLKDMVWTVSCKCCAVGDKVYMGAFEVVVTDEEVLPLNTCVSVEVNDCEVKLVEDGSVIDCIASSFISGGTAVMHPARL